jgi:hypothetical protein
MGFVVCPRNRFRAVFAEPRARMIMNGHPKSNQLPICFRQAKTRTRTEFRQMKQLSPAKIVKGVVFTAEEHLRVQQQIERRARALWHAGGCRHDTTLNDWLGAEREVLEQFIRAYVQRHSLLQFSRPRSTVGGARREPETRVPKCGRTEVIDVNAAPNAFGVAQEDSQ